MRTEAAVVGAGPAGLIAARELARRGVEVKVFEEHPVIGEPNHCAGILSVEGLRRLGVEPDNRFIRHEIRGGTAFSPNGTGIRITCSRTRLTVKCECVDMPPPGDFFLLFPDICFCNYSRHWFHAHGSGM